MTTAPTIDPDSPPLVEAAPTILLHSGMNVSSVFTTYTIGALFPLAAGLAMFGWRAAVTVLAVVGSAAIAMLVWKQVGVRGGQLRLSSVLWNALVLAMLLPASMATRLHGPHATQVWPILPAAGLTLVMVTWLFGGVGVGRLHPVLASYLLLYALFGAHFVSHDVLQRDTLLTGNVLDVDHAHAQVQSHDPWISRPIEKGHAALRAESASEQLQQFTRGIEPTWTSMDTLVRDRMPPIQDLILAGNPGPIGQASAVAIVMGMLYLLYRGVIDYRIPFLIVLSLVISLHVLPVPVVISDRIHWGWLILRDGRVGWATAMTFVHYEVLASPALFIAMFLATDPTLRPMARWSRAVYAIFIGVATAAGQRYLSISVGPMIAVLTASLLTPLFDGVFRPRPIV